MRYLRDEGRLLSEGIDFPPLKARFRDRHALVVARGPGYKRDLHMVRPYVRDFKPVLVAVDGGADALLEAGLTPRRDRRRHGLGLRPRARARAPSSSSTPTAAARRRARAGSSGSALPYQVVSAPGISEDVALLLAYEKGAALIVAVGTHFNLIEFLERDRDGMSSTFVTRLKVGEILVDAKGVSRLASRQVGVWPLVAFVVAAISAVVVAVAASPALRHLIELFGLRLRSLLGLGLMPTREATAELLASREDVWAFLAEPYHLADWWPGIGGVQPDRRGLAPGARWEVYGGSSPTLLRTRARARRAARGRGRAARAPALPAQRPAGSTSTSASTRRGLAARPRTCG